MSKNCPSDVTSSPSQNGTLFFGLGTWEKNGTLRYGEQEIAAFLIIRGPSAFIGYGWEGCTDQYAVPFPRPHALDVDYGAPVDPRGVCTETSPGSGVFVREFTKASVTMDCGAWHGSITMKTM